MINRKTHINNYKMVFLGDTAVGKSCISSRYIRNEFYEFQEPTIGAAFLSKTININNKDIRLDIWDTAGQERYRSLAPMYYRGAHGAFIVYDVTNPDSFIGAQTWINELYKKAPHCIILLLGNKYDLKKNIKISQEEVNTFCETNNIKHIYVSAKTGENIEEAFNYIIKLLPEKTDILIDDKILVKELEKIGLMQKGCC